MILNEPEIGAIGLIYWMCNVQKELTEDEVEKIRQKSISDTLNSTLINKMYEPAKAINSMDGVIQRGFDEAKKQIHMMENGTTTLSKYVMIDSNIKQELSEIEKSKGFAGWCNPYLIDEIKQLDV